MQGKGIRYRFDNGLFIKFFIKTFGLFSVLVSYIYFPKIARFMIQIRSVLIGNLHKRYFKYCGENLRVKSGSYFLGHFYICLGSNVSFGYNSVCTAWKEYNGSRFSPSIMIGNNCSFGDRLHITSINSISIGDCLLTGRDVTITDNSHGSVKKEEVNVAPLIRPLYSKGKVCIGDNVWLGDKVTILPGVTLGNGCIVAANSVVTKSFPDNSVVAGNPAKLIKQL